MITVDIEKKLRGYGGQQVLKISSEFPHGSITKIYGPSGAGKTTFLKIIAGLIEPEKGMIISEGNTWLDTEAGISLSPQKRKAGFVFQNYALFPNMNIRQHLEYATNDKQWINRLLKTGKLDTLSTHKPEYLSGGQQQRLAILRALAIKPKLLLMDEPFSALDPEMRLELIKVLRDIWKEFGMTVFIVSHDQRELDGIAEGELLINNP
ncbi:MAG TPA: ATP-binding cassette domain-containing protein [Mucilaginibacter sp.]|jgi:molybdate transport system ATP-binding protein|nr:ATP-binding cassette domain-containing protein [Mucilaginibacter sp.]